VAQSSGHLGYAALGDLTWPRSRGSELWIS